MTDDALSYLSSFEGQLLLSHKQRGNQIHRDKLPYEIEDLLRYRIHPEKVSWQLQRYLERMMEEGWLAVDSSFAAYYMTLLANRICEDNFFALLTDNTLAAGFAEKVRVDEHPLPMNPIHDEMRRPRKFQQEFSLSNIAQGLLVNLVVNGVKLSPDTILEDVMRFKKKNRDELGEFRNQLSKLTEHVSVERPINALRREIRDIYTDRSCQQPCVN